MNKQRFPLHPKIYDLQHDLQAGRLSRRAFLRSATLLGASVGMAMVLAGCHDTPAQNPTPTTVPINPAELRRGGSITIGSLVPRADDPSLEHPARLSWIEAANQVRQVAETLTETGSDNLTRPWLLERWEPEEDLKTWTLILRRGITFNNGQPLTADDVIFSFNQWLDPQIGSSMLSLLTYLKTNDIERVDDYTLRLHLQAPQIAVPEYLAHYPAVILPHTFDGDFWKNPIGTGPFLLDDYQSGERSHFVRRPDYWRFGIDDQPLPYLDEIIYQDLAPDERVAAMQAGLIDMIARPRPADWEALRTAPNLQIVSNQSSVTLVLRMRADRKPWDDPRVRNALKLCQNRERILDITFAGQGDLALDAHVAPVHPAYCTQPIPEYAPEQARQLLAEAGYPEGIQATIVTKNDRGEPAMARAIQQLAAAAGFRFDITILEPSRYWERWKEVDLGITSWTHRPLATMALALAYTADADNEPVAWNETRWVDSEFITLLRQAESTLDIEERRTIMCQLQSIMQERGPVGISYWQNIWTIARAEFGGLQAHPNNFDLIADVWKTNTD